MRHAGAAWRRGRTRAPVDANRRSAALRGYGFTVARNVSVDNDAAERKNTVLPISGDVAQLGGPIIRKRAPGATVLLELNFDN